jgi:hypothetical protein
VDMFRRRTVFERFSQPRPLRGCEAACSATMVAWRIPDSLHSFICFALTNDLVNNLRDRCGGVDYNTAFSALRI